MSPLPLLLSRHPATMYLTNAEASMMRKFVSSGVIQKPKPTTKLRSMATTLDELPRPPPPKQMPDPVAFEAVARPGAYYERPRIKRDLPTIGTPWMGMLAFGAAGVLSWAAFLSYATNQERLSSTVVRRIVQNLRASELVREALGDGVRPEPTWYLNGDPWINGSINMLQGSVDISMRVKGSKGVGTLYFTSIRREKGEKFEILRFKIICDNGTVLNLPTSQE